MGKNPEGCLCMAYSVTVKSSQQSPYCEHLRVTVDLRHYCLSMGDGHLFQSIFCPGTFIVHHSLIGLPVPDHVFYEGRTTYCTLSIQNLNLPPLYSSSKKITLMISYSVLSYNNLTYLFYSVYTYIYL